MELKKDVVDCLDSLIQKEWKMMGAYMSMGSWAARGGYPGVSEWLFSQYGDRQHCMADMTKYIADHGGIPLVPAVAAPEREFSGLGGMLGDLSQMMEALHGSVSHTAHVCQSVRDYGTLGYMQEYAGSLAAKIRALRKARNGIKLSGGNLYELDKDMGEMASHRGQAKG